MAHGHGTWDDYGGGGWDYFAENWNENWDEYVNHRSYQLWGEHGFTWQQGDHWYGQQQDYPQQWGHRGHNQRDSYSRAYEQWKPWNNNWKPRAKKPWIPKGRKFHYQQSAWTPGWQYWVQEDAVLSPVVVDETRSDVHNAHDHVEETPNLKRHSEKRVLCINEVITPVPSPEITPVTSCPVVDGPLLDSPVVVSPAFDKLVADFERGKAERRKSEALVGKRFSDFDKFVEATMGETWVERQDWVQQRQEGDDSPMWALPDEQATDQVTVITDPGPSISPPCSEVRVCDVTVLSMDQLVNSAPMELETPPRERLTKSFAKEALVPDMLLDAAQLLEEPTTPHKPQKRKKAVDEEADQGWWNPKYIKSHKHGNKSYNGKWKEDKWVEDGWVDKKVWKKKQRAQESAEKPMTLVEYVEKEMARPLNWRSKTRHPRWASWVRRDSVGLNPSGIIVNVTEELSPAELESHAHLDAAYPFGSHGSPKNHPNTKAPACAPPVCEPPEVDDLVEAGAEFVEPLLLKPRKSRGTAPRLSLPPFTDRQVVVVEYEEVSPSQSLRTSSTPTAAHAGNTPRYVPKSYVLPVTEARIPAAPAQPPKMACPAAPTHEEKPEDARSNSPPPVFVEPILAPSRPVPILEGWEEVEMRVVTCPMENFVIPILSDDAAMSPSTDVQAALRNPPKILVPLGEDDSDEEWVPMPEEVIKPQLPTFDVKSVKSGRSGRLSYDIKRFRPVSDPNMPGVMWKFSHVDMATPPTSAGVGSPSMSASSMSSAKSLKSRSLSEKLTRFIDEPEGLPANEAAQQLLKVV